MTSPQTFQPDGTAGLDSDLRQSAATTNNGTSAGIYAGLSGSKYRIVLKFSGLSDGTIPASAIVDSAVLSVWTSEDDGADTSTNLSVFRFLKAWVESQVTWNIYSTGNNWTTAGGFDAADCEQSNIGSVSQGTHEAVGTQRDITLTSSKIQEIISGSFANNGFLLKTDNESSGNTLYRYYSSDEATQTTKRPKLVVTYHLPNGQTRIIVLQAVQRAAVM